MNHLESESIEGALPIGQNSPQHCPLGLFAEQLSGTAFTAPRSCNLRSWLYRRKPSVVHSKFIPTQINKLFGGQGVKFKSTPCQLRWSPFHICEGDFVEGLKTIGLTGSADVKNGMAVHLYSMTKAMSESKRALQNSDGDLLIVPQMGSLSVHTEFGLLQVDTKEIIIIPRGVRFTVDINEPQARGYILEVFNGHFELPDLGPIGANGLANPHHFIHPRASEHDVALGSKCTKWTVFNKYNNELFQAEQEHSPYNVVAWRGNYIPCKYNLTLFNTINTVSFDHPVQ
jgi:homogentisate 1,2-dioxygenase